MFNTEDPVWKPHAFYLSLLELLKTPELEDDVEELIRFLNA